MKVDKLNFMWRLIAVCWALSILSCSLDNNTGSPMGTTAAGIALFHCAPQTPTAAVTIDSNPVTGGSLSYGAFSGYATVNEGLHKVRLNATSDNSIVLDSSYTVQALTTSTVFLYNIGGQTKSILALDAASVIGQNNAVFRFAHLSSDTPDVKVGISGQSKQIAEQIAFKGISLFTGYLAQQLTVEVRAVSDNHLIISKIIDSVPGKYYTIVLAGSVSAPVGNVNALKLIVGESN